MGLADKVDAELEKTKYPARECISSGRKRMQFCGVDYCSLSGACDIYCPLQAEKKDGEHLSRCLFREYDLALVERGKNLRQEGAYSPPSSDDKLVYIKLKKKTG